MERNFHLNSGEKKWLFKLINTTSWPLRRKRVKFSHAADNLSRTFQICMTLVSLQRALLHQSKSCPWWSPAFELKKEQKSVRGEDGHWSHGGDLRSIIVSIISAGQASNIAWMPSSRLAEGSGQEEAPTDELPQAESVAWHALPFTLEGLDA